MLYINNSLQAAFFLQEPVFQREESSKVDKRGGPRVDKKIIYYYYNLKEKVGEGGLTKLIIFFVIFFLILLLDFSAI